LAQVGKWNEKPNSNHEADVSSGGLWLRMRSRARLRFKKRRFMPNEAKTDNAAVTLTVDSGIAVVTLNRPEKLNALNRDLLYRLVSTFKHIDQDASIRAVVLTGAGRAFSSGADLSSGQESQHPYGRLGEVIMPACSQIRRCSKPVVVALNGAAAGAGASIALSGDIVLAAESSYLLLAFVNVGLVPDGGLSWILPRTIGHPRFVGMAMLGRKIFAKQAAEWGLLWDCVPDDRLMVEAHAVASQLANGPTKTISLIKELTRYCDRNDYEGQMVLEAQMQQIASNTADSSEARRAFLEKRKPIFKGQ